MQDDVMKTLGMLKNKNVIFQGQYGCFPEDPKILSPPQQ